MNRDNAKKLGVALLLLPCAAFAVCPTNNTTLTQLRECQEREAQQQRAEQEAKQRSQQEAQQQAQPQAQMRTQQEVQQRTQQEAQQRAQQQAQQRVQQEEQQRAQQEAQQRAQQQAQQRMQQESQQRTQQEAQQRIRQQAPQQLQTQQPPRSPEPVQQQPQLRNNQLGQPDQPREFQRQSGQPQRAVGQGQAASGVENVQHAPSRQVIAPQTLDPRRSAAAIGEINQNRSSFAGINSKPLPSGTVTAMPSGHLVVHTPNGQQYGVRPNGTLASVSTQAGRATFTPSGHVQTMRTPTLDVMHGTHGDRTVVERRPGSATVVSFGRGGYVERPYRRDGRSLVQRTWIVDDHRYTRMYTPYTYHELRLVNYQPQAVYVPAYYGWTYYPWARPVAYYSWGWTTAVWYRDQGDNAYFVVSPLYPSASVWLSDYVIGTTMQTAYVVPPPDTAPPDDTEYVQMPPGDVSDASDVVYAEYATPITPELKDALADQVRQQVSIENAAAQSPDSATDLSGLAPAMQPNHMFIVDRPLTVITDDERNCSLSAGDVLRLTEVPPDDATSAALTVAASRQGECPGNAQVIINFSDLQEMHNSFRSQLDAGLAVLHDRQGRDGLPAAPQSAIAPPPRPTDAPPPDGDAGALLRSAQQDADRSERTMVSQFQ